MKQVLGFILAVLLLCGTAFGAGSPVSTAVGVTATSGQVACGETATLLLAPNTTGRLSVTFQNQDASLTAVYISPRSDISTSNAGVLLDATHGGSVTFDRTSGDVAWYCITASGSVTVGYTEEKQQ